MEDPSASSSQVWTPITDLSGRDTALSSDELPQLARVWQEERAALADERTLKDFNVRLQREWAIETGIIERIYTLDRGVTSILIERGIDASLIPDDATDHPPQLVARIIRDQQAGVELLFDIVAQRRPFTVGFIKELHALMTRSQITTTAVDQFGHEIQLPLQHGEFKDRPNNPTRTDGTIHEYCPPLQVASEMDRLMQMHEEHLRQGVAPEISSAWLHHRFTQIHPFQDGNGRVARALASLVFISAGWFPLVITRDDRAQYLDALEVADRGDLSALVQLFVARQRKAFVAGLGIAREVTQEGQRIDQQIAAIADMFARRDRALRAEQDHAKELARIVWSRGVERLQQLATQLEASISSPSRNRRASVDSASDRDTARKNWNRFQIIQTARQLGYYAGLRDFACWGRVRIDTESGRGEILLAFHEIGPEFRGVVGGSLSFYRRQESADDDRHIAVDIQAASDEVFQINYMDSEKSVTDRFDRWLERGLVRALDCWRRGE